MGASAHEIVMESRQEIVDKLIAQMEKGYASTRAAWNSMKNRTSIQSRIGGCL